jgi:ADP-ribosylglycohydrolase
MAAAIALLADGASLDAAFARARQEFPADSWIAHVDAIAQACVTEASAPEDIVLLLDQRVINTVYSFGSIAPETLPAAMAIATVCDGALHRGCGLATALSKSADSVPAMVGALGGCLQGIEVLSERWRSALRRSRGVCLPFLKDADLEALTLALLSKTES